MRRCKLGKRISHEVQLSRALPGLGVHQPVTDGPAGVLSQYGKGGDAPQRPDAPARAGSAGIGGAEWTIHPSRSTSTTRRLGWIPTVSRSPVMRHHGSGIEFVHRVGHSLRSVENMAEVLTKSEPMHTLVAPLTNRVEIRSD